MSIYQVISLQTRLKKVRDREHMTFFGISSKNFYAYFKASFFLFLLFLLLLIFLFCFNLFFVSLRSFIYFTSKFKNALMKCLWFCNIPISHHGEMYQEILNQPKLVLNNPVNSLHTKVDKSKLVLNSNKFHIMVYTCPKESCQFKLDKTWQV